jgi:hypothetical protein
MSMLLQTVLAAETHFAEGLALKLRCTEKNKIVPDIVVGMRKLTESRMEGQAMFPLKALMRNPASS